MKTFNIIITILISIAFLVVIGKWSDKRSEVIEENAKLYEECVMREYGTTPMAYYHLNGELPYCESRE